MRSALYRQPLFLVVAFASAYCVVRGFPHLVSNQIHYFLAGEAWRDPTFITQDWFTWQTAPTHPVFGLLQAGLSVGLPWSYTALALHWVSAILFFAALYVGVRRSTRISEPVFILLATLVCALADHEIALGGLTPLGSYLQPSSLACALILAGLALAGQGRLKGSAGCIAAGFLLHAGWAFTFAPFIAWLAWRQRCWHAGFWLIVAALVAQVGYALWLSVGAGSFDAFYASVLFDFRAPHHYRLGHWDLAQSLRWGFVVVLGGVCLSYVSRLGRSLWWSSVVIVGIGMLLQSAFPSSQLQHLMLWRLSFLPFLLSWSAILTCAVTLVGARSPKRYFRLFALLAVAAGVLLTGDGVQTRGHTRPVSHAELAAWLRHETPADAIIVAPPDMGELRLTARRALIADYKCVPLRPVELKEWYRRLSDLVGRDARQVNLLAAYQQLGLGPLAKLRQEYQATYAVFRRASRVEQTGSQPIYHNRDFAVFKLD